MPSFVGINYLHSVVVSVSFTTTVQVSSVRRHHKTRLSPSGAFSRLRVAIPPPFSPASLYSSFSSIPPSAFAVHLHSSTSLLLPLHGPVYLSPRLGPSSPRLYTHTPPPGDDLVQPTPPWSRGGARDSAPDWAFVGTTRVSCSKLQPLPSLPPPAVALHQKLLLHPPFSFSLFTPPHFAFRLFRLILISLFTFPSAASPTFLYDTQPRCEPQLTLNRQPRDLLQLFIVPLFLFFQPTPPSPIHRHSI